MQTGCFKINLGNYPYYELNARENGEIQYKNEEKAQHSDAKKRGKDFAARTICGGKIFWERQGDERATGKV